MRCKNVEEYLIGIADGSISPADRTLVEHHLASCPECRRTLALLQTVFGDLRDMNDEDVPTHYFTNFLPRVRERIEERKVSKLSFIPRWLGIFSSPVTALLIVLSFVGLFWMFQPSDSESSLREIVGREPMDQIMTLSSTNYDMISPLHITSMHDKTLELISNSPTIERAMRSELFANTNLFSDVVPGILNYNFPGNELTEEEADILVEQMNDQSLF